MLAQLIGIMGDDDGDLGVLALEGVQRRQLIGDRLPLLVEIEAREERADPLALDARAVPGDVADEDHLAPVGQADVDELRSGAVAGRLLQHDAGRQPVEALVVEGGEAAQRVGGEAGRPVERVIDLLARQAGALLDLREVPRAAEAGEVIRGARA